MTRLRTFVLPLVCLVTACGTKPPATCEPKTCSILGVNCGQVSDGCSGALECGLCTEPETCGGAGVANVCGVGLPPDPKTLAPSLDPTVPTDFADSLEFLYRGDRPIQLGVKDGTIDKLRIGWIRGRATSPDGKPLPGVAIDVLGHPEFGSTLTRADGQFDLVVNAGGLLVVRYRHASRLEVQRCIFTEWRQVTWTPDVVLIPLDQVAGTFSADSSELQVARASEVSDRHGKRRGTLLMRPGTVAHMKLPDGSRKPLSSMHVRITEFTVGEQGPQQMPADLPPQTGYTYAAEFSIDEARAAGATGVEFNKPVVAYVDNFLGYLDGQPVPRGYFDPAGGVWKSERSGRIVRVVAIADGTASVDLDGDGIAESADALLAQGLDGEELRTLSSMFKAGDSLWRVELEHLSIFDLNWAARCPKRDDSTESQCKASAVEQDFFRPTTCQDESDGSIIRCQDQTLGEAIAVAGTPYRITTWSDRARGSRNTLDIALTSQAPLEPALTAIWLQVSIAGQQLQKKFTRPFTADMRFPFEWDGRDAFGRLLQGPQRVTVKVGYVYALEPLATPGFADYSDAELAVPPDFDPTNPSKARSELMVERTWRGWLGTLQTSELGLGGWDFDVHHVYDPQLRMLHSGTGGVVSGDTLPLAVHDFAGTGETGNDGDGKPAPLAKLGRPAGLAVWPDGSVAISDEANDSIRRVSPDGKIATLLRPGTPNLLRNAGCEQGLEGWTVAQGSWACAATDLGKSLEGGSWFTQYNAGAGAEVFQDVDVGILPATRLSFSAFLRSDTPEQPVRLVVEYRNASGVVLTAFDTGPRAPTARWAEVSDTRDAPAGTRTVRVRLVSLSAEGAAAIDALSLRVSGESGIRNPRGLAVGPDDSLYIAAHARVWRLKPDGVLVPFAGTGEVGFSGDGGPATAAKLRMPWGVAVGPDGSVFITDHADNRIRKVGPEGRITTVAGDGAATNDGDTFPATMASILQPTGIAVDREGVIYFASGAQVRRVVQGGLMYPFAGRCAAGAGNDGLPADSACFSWLFGVAAGPTGEVYLTEGGDPQKGHRVHRVGADGMLNSLVGARQDLNENGGPSTLTRATDPQSLAVLPTGDVLFAEYSGSRVRVLRPTFPGPRLSGEERIADASGTVVHVFDRLGRHLRTVDGITDLALVTFGYDEKGRLATLTDREGRITRVERDALGRPAAFVAPHGQRTTLTVDADGMLASVTNPATERVSMTYEGKRLKTFVDARGGEHRFTYDSAGRLIRDEGPEGRVQTLTRTPTETGFYVDLKTGLERTRRHQVGFSRAGTTTFTNKDAAGTITKVFAEPSGNLETVYADKSRAYLEVGPDPRFLTQAPIARAYRYELPSTLAITGSESRRAWWDETGRLSKFEVKSTVGADTSKSVYDAAEKTVTLESAERIKTTLTLDEKGRVVQAERAGLATVTAQYDVEGRVTRVTQGDRVRTFSYAADGALSSTTGPMERTTSVLRDAVQRPTQLTAPDGISVDLRYDSGGLLDRVTLPQRPFEYAYSKAPVQTSFTPPGSPATTYVHDADRALTQVNLPGAATISIDRDAAGRPWRVRHADGSLLIGYEESTGRVASLASPHVSTSYEYDGPLVTKATLSGPVSGSVAYRYDDHFRLVGTTVDAGAEVAFEYDGDGRLVRAGDYAFRYDPATGLPSQADGLAVTEELAFSKYAELQSTKVTTPNRHVLTFEYVRDDLGRVTAKKETVGAEDPVLFEYSYDASNRLTEVRRDGAVEGAWTYDAQGNRATETRKGKTTTGVFDSGDRLLSWGATTYTWGPAGDLQSRTRPGEPKATYKYDALGNLLEARLPDGRKVEYLVDHAGRRVGKKVDGVLVQRFLWESPLRIAAELDGEGNLVSRFVYGTKVNVPELIIKHGVTYRVLTDELGSPRLVFDPATEAVVQRMDYDAWGNVTADSNPGFQPFGFAGGLWDRDLGWVRFGARDYDPETGTWTRPEPILSSAGAVAGYAAAGVRLGKYGYAGNNPILFVDPTGLLPGEPFGTPEEAAADAAKWIPFDGNEWGGGIHRNPDGTYRADWPTTGGHDSTRGVCGPSPGSVRHESGNAGNYHNHPLRSFSPGPGDYGFGGVGVLITPSGQPMSYDPASPPPVFTFPPLDLTTP